ncbi:shikimate kinase [Eubacterium oxidoreducens]|uniref:Shikimate kinase n=1 Tax=Eubacterium oxidoreducens TaxID=1732 RepID=A0A1G6AJL5_EUBOX|nr:shikimate kinase [Eubacterium oxidoreducens]SDB08598.1 shikimate kinase [Eubacterium oxidoreducens]
MKAMVNDMIFLIGFMGAGKTAVSKELAKKANMKLIDTDEYIEKKEGMKIPEIFDKYGEEYFRNIETQCLKEIVSKEEAIVSCGGGIIMKEENVKVMKAAGKVVFLKTSPETIYQRVKKSQNRPMLKGHMNVEYIEKLLNERQPFYDRAKDCEICTDNRTVSAIAQEILCFL